MKVSSIHIFIFFSLLQLMTGVRTNYILMGYVYIPSNPADFYAGDFYSIVQSYENNGTSCLCSLWENCSAASHIYDDIDEKIPIFNVTGFVSACYPLKALLMSTLECFYSAACFTALQKFIYPSNSTTSLSALSSESTLFSKKMTVEEMLNLLLVEHWTSNISHQSYYEECRPAVCTYSRLEGRNLVYIISAMLGLAGGLFKILMIFAPIITDAVYSIKNKPNIHQASSAFVPSKYFRIFRYRNHLVCEKISDYKREFRIHFFYLNKLIFFLYHALKVGQVCPFRLTLE